MRRLPRLGRWAAFQAGLALLLFAAPGDVRAAVEVGADAPDVTAGAFINTEPLALADLRGRVVFLELFSTT